MKWTVVDTNVLVVANGGAPQAGQRCRVAAEKTLLDIRDRASLVLDDSWQILAEYWRTTHSPEQPGVGSQFFRWAAQLSGIRQVAITPHTGRGFVEFPQDPGLEGFHRDDRKFVATVVAAGREETELVNAVDSDYFLHRIPLREAGIRVGELCPQMIRRDR